MATKDKSQDNAENGDPMAEVKEIIAADIKTLRPSQRAVLELLTWLENQATEDTEEKGFSGDDIANILLAEDEAQMWDADELPRLNAKVLSGTHLEIFGYEVKFSDDPEIVTGLMGPSSMRKMYLLLRSARTDAAGESNLYKLPAVGEEFVWNTSARFIVAKIYWLAVRGRFDNGNTVKAQIVGTDLGGGKSVEKLKPLMDFATVSGQAEEPPF